MKNGRRKFSGEEKMAILRRHLVEKMPVSDVCDQAGINPTLFYRWQKELFEHGAATFGRRGNDGRDRKLTVAREGRRLHRRQAKRLSCALESWRQQTGGFESPWSSVASASPHPVLGGVEATERKGQPQAVPEPRPSTEDANGMDPRRKIDKLRSLDEAALREEVLSPLLMRMGFKAVTVYHGTNEHGKDLICFDFDRLEKREYYAVVAKATKLTGDVSSSRGLQTVLFQIEQCFNVPYENLFNMARVTMDRVWVVSSESISPGAEQTIFSQLEKSNLAKLVRFIPVENLVGLIDKYLPAYWDDSLEPIDVVKEQKQRLIAFARQLLLALGGDPSDIGGTLKQVVNSAFPPQVRPASNRLVNTVSPYNVEIDTIDPDYAHDFWSVNYGLIRPLYLKAKKDLYCAMFEFDEILDHFDEVIAQTNPAEVARVFDHHMSNEYPFRGPCYGRAGDAVQSMQYLEEAAGEIEELRENLQKLGKLGWATSLVDSVADLKPEIEACIADVTDEKFQMCWKIESENNRTRLRLLYDPKAEDRDAILTTDHEKTIQTSWRETITTKPITANDVVEKTQAAIRNHLDQLLINADK